jgi:hypothetical protein
MGQEDSGGGRGGKFTVRSVGPRGGQARTSTHNSIREARSVAREHAGTGRTARVVGAPGGTQVFRPNR